MKVSELNVGMLLQTVSNWEITYSAWPAYEVGSLGKTRFEKGVPGVTVTHAWNREPEKALLMFVGTTKDNFTWGGTLTHHRFLWNGRAVIMTGYDIRYLEKFEAPV